MSDVFTAFYESEIAAVHASTARVFVLRPSALFAQPANRRAEFLRVSILRTSSWHLLRVGHGRVAMAKLTSLSQPRASALNARHRIEIEIPEGLCGYCNTGSKKRTTARKQQNRSRLTM